MIGRRWRSLGPYVAGCHRVGYSEPKDRLEQCPLCDTK